ncbi:zinc finger CCCH domain-containing protein 7-like isoform X1 [Actinidia eriantha]|uniref:zinc finger CCCH domain-containing protein 7-like isoform X1 n=1 Tax=Actinidia eriantha TaxID=165200 RepID=UPI0025908A05|nr:zinc finger CCCH domain-containing protein 7-like isoform X1 [Actinidia eriantha]
MDETKKRTGLDATLERPKTPPLPCSTKLSNFTTFSSGKGTSSPLADPPENGCSETESDPLQRKDMDVPKPSEEAPNSSGTHGNQTGQINNNETQSVQEDGNSVSIKSKKIVYVKRKSNQLVATSSSSDRSLQNVDKTEALSSDSYYNRRKNQIIRKLSQVAEKVSTSDERKRALPATTSSFSRRRSDKGIAKTYKPSKFSLVWTLRDAQSMKKGNTLIRQVWPHLFPWKRATHWRSLMHTSASNFNNSSLSTISRKLLLSRKRETIYTRSTRGFSLRKSKVLSVGGSSLKWSKSIETNSKKANEEATLAVAAVEKRKREHNGAGTGAGAGAGAGAAAATATAVTKNRNRSFRKSVHSIELRPGERIYRVGSVRYKMDPTRRTLQRISDEELSNSVALQSGKDAKKSSVPKRLLIGNDEYVRISNGKLIRDPKKRTRMLASEKVRWSLHTARLRLARKRKYCQFFTRFGKCNKDDGKCPYIHDPSKIAICTKFLKGSCSDPKCKLTHKVIPERMQDCSYFLQGLCTNESCPYRHVNVNPNASICDGFLRGYCADGNECRKKHSYICPTFEENGICTQGSKCKLHHPKNRNKGKKKKPSAAQKNARGRYFGSNISEHRTLVSEKHSTKHNDDIFCQEGKFADYIHLDFSDDEAEEISDPASERTISRDGDLTDMELDVDELIKPFNLIRRSMAIESSPAG